MVLLKHKRRCNMNMRKWCYMLQWICEFEWINTKRNYLKRRGRFRTLSNMYHEIFLQKYCILDAWQCPKYAFETVLQDKTDGTFWLRNLRKSAGGKSIFLIDKLNGVLHLFLGSSRKFWRKNLSYFKCFMIFNNICRYYMLTTH